MVGFEVCDRSPEAPEQVPDHTIAPDPVRRGDIPPELIEAGYNRLRAIASRRLRAESPGHTLEPTALVHESLVRLCRTPGLRVRTQDDLDAILASVMRRVLVDHARRRDARRRRERAHAHRQGLTVASPDRVVEGLLDLDRAIESLESLAPRQARVLELHYFGGLATDTIARILGVSRRTVQLELAIARDSLGVKISGDHRVVPADPIPR